MINAEVNRHIAENIHYLRKKHGLTQATLAAQIGIGVGSRSIRRICEIFGIRADDFLLCDIEALDCV